jgi:hypothetical protein
MRARLEAGELEDRTVELTIETKAVPVQIFFNLGIAEKTRQDALEDIHERSLSYT